MPRYYFHTEDGRCLPDESGTELAGIEEAKVEALKYLCQRVNDEPHLLWDTGNWRVVVQNGDGLTLFMLDLSAVFASAFPLSAMPQGRARAH